MLFIIVMEAFSHLIVKATGAGMLTSFSVGSIDGDPLEVSHLLFADDTLIFCEADPDQLFHLRSVLFWFEVTSGLRINLGKSELVPVGAVPYIEELADILGCKTSQLPMKYLGLPLGQNSKQNSKPRIYGIRLLKRWSSVWRLDVAHRIEKIQRNFLWGTFEEVAKFHLVKWDMVCSPYSHGGLAIKNLRRFNEALLGKWLWQFGVERDAFWRKVIKAKYSSLDGGWMSKAPTGPHGPLKLAYSELYHIACVKEGPVADFVQCRGHELGLKDSKLSLSILNSLPWSWFLSLEEYMEGLRYLQGCLFCVWTATLGKILPADNLCRRGIPVVSWCCMCKADAETVDHLLLHCSYAKELWDMVFGLFGIQWVMPKRVIDLLYCWLGSVGCNSMIWKAIPHCIMWCLWRERNARTFEDCELSVVELKLRFYRSLLD
uniref:Reverse transcriptase zinc-binding domain-containing protein n=1 Tax=Fagus sylvatica TaxID=28930 RepID=A0A2N9IS02_FAGSY